MRTLERTLKLATGIMWSVLIAMLIWQTIDLMQATRGLVMESRRRLVDVSQNANGTLIQLGLTLDKVNHATDEQEEYWKRTSIGVAGAVEGVRDASQESAKFIRELNQSVQAQLLPSAEESFQKAAEGITLVSEQTTATLQDVQPVLRRIETAADALSERMSDPNLAEMVRNLNDAASDTAVAARNVAATSARVDVAVERATRPARLVVRIFGGALDLTVKAAQILTGVR